MERPAGQELGSFKQYVSVVPHSNKNRLVWGQAPKYRVLGILLVQNVLELC